MTIKKFARFLARLEATPARNEITKILAELINQASAQEIDKACYLTLGKLAPPFRKIDFNLADKTMIKAISLAFGAEESEVRKLYKKMGDLGEVAIALKKKSRQKIKSTSTSVSQTYKALLKIALDCGLGSQERKIQAMAKLLKESDPLFLKFLARIPVGRLRLGFSDITIMDALSWARVGDKSLRKDIEAKYNIFADIGQIARAFKKGGLGELGKIKAKPGTPLRVARAERLPTAEKIIEKLDVCAVEPKIDGFRVQLHLDKNQSAKAKSDGLFASKRQPLVKIFSRSLENTTHMFPDIVKAGRKLLKTKKTLINCILDGEAIGINLKTGRLLPFQETVQRKRKHGIAQASKDVPLVVFVFDLLYLNNRSLLNQPFRERRKRLEKIIPVEGPIRLTPQKIISKASLLKKEFKKAYKDNLEGIMCKKLDSVYQAGGRNYNWVKYKKALEEKIEDTIDCLVMGYYSGRGRRAGFGIGAFLTGVYNAKKGWFETVAKIGTGLTDDQWREMKKRCDKVKTIKRPKQYRLDKNLNPDVWCLPSIVVEIKADEITKSPIHTSAKGYSATAKRILGESGLALRFPRLVKFRDKKPEQATTTKELIKLFREQQS